MKPKFLVPIMLIVFLAGSDFVMGQDRNEKKMERIQRKIEKQTKKLQELSGETHAFTYVSPNVRVGEIGKIRREAFAQQQRAMKFQRESLGRSREAMRDQKREIEEQMKEIQEKNFEKLDQMKELNLDKLKELKEIEIQGLKDNGDMKYHYYYKTPKYKYNGTEPVVINVPDIDVDVPAIKGGVYNFFSDSQDNLSINKDLTDESSTADFNYEVKEGAKGMSLRVNGTIDSGKVVVAIKRPDGELFNEYTLSSLANVNWRQNLKFEDQKESEYLGKWTVTISAEKAKGNYSVQISGR